MASIPRKVSTRLLPIRRLLSTAATCKELPSSARVVIVGGGIIGTSVAYHLAHAGCKDVLLLERDKLTSGTTWHAAGLMVTFGSLSETATEIRKYSKQLYASLEEETGQSTGFKDCGFIELATDRDRLEEYRRIAAFNRKCGVDVQEISPQEVASLFPLCRTDDLEAGFYVASDGRVNPVDATAALAKGARQQGATIAEGCPVARVTDDGRGKVSGVLLEDGRRVGAEVVVNCGGMWARQLAEANGVALPNQAAEHYYLITDAMPGVDPDWPVVEDPSRYAYIRPEGGGLMVGLFEAEGAAWGVGRVPSDFSFGELPPDWERLAPYLEAAMGRVPATLEVGAKKLFCGPESFTPDGAPLVGEAPELQNYFVAAGMNSVGVLSGGGVGRLLSHWILTGLPDMDVTGLHVDRFQKWHCTPAFRRARCGETLGDVYAAHYPHKPKRTARGAKRSPLHDRLEGLGAAFRDVSGWECADWFAPGDDAAAREVGPLSWGRHHWFDRWAAEHAACRESAAILDMSFMSKFRVEGPEAGPLLDVLSTAAVDRGVVPGTITYTQWLNRDGKVEADLTVTKLPNRTNDAAAQAFLVVATDTAHRHVETRMRRYIAGAGDEAGAGPFTATVTDVTSGLAQINLQGPNARRILAAALVGSGDGDGGGGGGDQPGADVSDAGFPFRAAREVSIGLAPCLAARITYVGELGFELFVDAAQAVQTYDALRAAAQKAGLPLAPAGLKALGSLRLEKGYRDFGHDVDNTDSLHEAGLGFTAAWGKAGGFVGRDAAMAQKQRGARALPQRLVSVALTGGPEEAEPPSSSSPKDRGGLSELPLLFHGEVVYRNGKVAGDVRSASYGHTLGAPVGLAMVSADGGPLTAKAVASDVWEVDVAGVRYPARASIKPFFDPDNSRIKA